MVLFLSCGKAPSLITENSPIYEIVEFISRTEEKTISTLLRYMVSFRSEVKVNEVF